VSGGWTERLAAIRPAGGATLMEVCGTHTMTARRAGLHALLPEGVRLLSGPGCPVCVTPVGYIDHAVALCQAPGVTVTSFGDLLRVPGSSSSLERVRAQGGEVQVVYSPLDALELADRERSMLVVFLGVGFETTAPTVAAAVLDAASRGLDNFAVLSAHRLIPPALEALLAPREGGAEQKLRIDGFLAPGHVTAIIGVAPYRFVASRHRRPVVVAGFEAEDMLLGIEAVLRQLVEGRAEVENGYRRVVRDEGNPRARALLDQVFEPVDCDWRGLGSIAASGLALRPELARFDASLRVEVELEPPREPAGCRCGDILLGEAIPEECPLFDRVCSPEHPVGACMVSTEGACSAAHRFGSIL
jgi:hydrogenase expression/formation protein HypD